MTIGVELGLTKPIAGFSGTAAMLAILQIGIFQSCGVQLLDIVAHPDAATPMVTDSQAILWPVMGLTGYFHLDELPSESLNWAMSKHSSTIHFDSTQVSVYRVFLLDS